MPDGPPDLFRSRWKTAPVTTSSFGTKSSTGEWVQSYRYDPPWGGLGSPVYFNPLLCHPHNGHTCGWRGELFGLVIPPSYPDPCIFYKEGI